MPTVKATFTADISQFRQSLAQATTAVTAFDRSTAQVNNDLKRFGNEFSGAKIQREALTLAKAISEVGGVTRLTDAELRKANVTITEAIAKYDRLGKEAPESLKTLAQAIQTMRGASAQLNDSIVAPEQATRGFGLLQGAVAGVAAAITTQGLTAVKAFASDIVKTAGDVADLSAKTGLTTGQVQRFGFAAQQTGSSVEVIANSVSQLSNRLIEGSTGTVTAVRRLGLSFEELQQQSPGAAFEQIAEAIRQVPDPMQQTQLAMELFGRSGAEILPAIKQGMTELGDEAERLGLVIDSEAVQALDNFGDRWDQMSLRAKAAAAGVLGDTLQIIDALTRLGSAAANALPAELRNSPIGRRLQSGGPFAFGAASIYGAAANFAADVIPFDGKLPEPAERPMAQGTPFTGIGAAEMRAAEQQSERAMAALDAGLRKASDAAKQLKADLDRITGRDLVANATKLAEQIAKVGVANVLPRSMPAFVEQLTTGLDRARELGPQFARSAQQIERALTDAVNSPAYREFFQRGLVNPSRILPGSAQIGGALTGSAFDRAVSPLPASTVPGAFDTIEAARQMRSIAGFVPDLQRGVKVTRDWRVELQGVAQAFANLAQVGGRSLDGLNRTMGAVFTSANAAVEMVNSLQKLGGVFGGLANESGEMSNAGRALAGGFAGLGTGLQVGGLFTNRGAGFASGAAGGAGAGFMAGGWIGAGVGALVGGFAGMFAAAANAAARRVAKDVQAAQLTAQFGGLEELLNTVQRLGLSQQTFLERYYGEPEEFAVAITELNSALESERIEVDKLAKSLEAAAKAQGILSRADLQRLANLRRGGPGDDVAKQFLEGQTGQLVNGLTSLLQNGQLSPEAVGGIGVSLGAAFTLMRQQGMSVKQILEALGPALDAFKQRAVEAGLGSTEQFDNLSRMLETLRGPLGAIIDGALGAGQALAALTNTGMINQEMFGGLTKAITDAYYNLELNGKGGRDAVLLLQGPLQNIWQLVQDFGLEVDDATQRLLDFALKEGLIGDQFRPATEQMVEALDRLIERMDEFLRLMAQVNGIEWPEPTDPGPPPPPPASRDGEPGTTPPNFNTFPTPEVIPFANGGIVTRATRALIGEAGPEAVIPLDRLRSTRGGGAVTIVSPVIVDGREVARAVNRYQGDERRLVGVA